MTKDDKKVYAFVFCFFGIPALLFFFLYFSGERHTRLTVKGNNPPQFQLRGSGELGVLRVMGPKKQRDIEGWDASAYWVIVPVNGYLNGDAIEDLSPITYGKIPKDYVQRYPEQGAAPPLVEGEKYHVLAETVNANHGAKYFFIQDGKAVEAIQ
jgi:hypothetical protein